MSDGCRFQTRSFPYQGTYGGWKVFNEAACSLTFKRGIKSMFIRLLCGYYPHNSYLNRTRDPRGLRSKDPNKEHKNFAAALEYSGAAQSSVHNQHIFHKPRSTDSGARQKIKVYKLYNIQRVKNYTRGLPPIQKLHSQTILILRLVLYGQLGTAKLFASALD